LLRLFDFGTATSPGWSTGGGSPSYPFTWMSGGGTLSGGTGPSAGVGGSGSYYYAEVSAPRLSGARFILAYDGSACTSVGSVGTVGFHYHMYGADMGELNLTNANGQTMWSLSGNQGTTWHSASVGVYSASFAFEYTTGNSFMGDAAVAQVAVSCGRAPPPSPA